MSEPRRRALCIGIDAYPKLRPGEQLEGCVNDARLAASVLTGSFGFAEEDVRLLLDEEASRDGILAAFDRLLDETGEGDVVVVHYSGHGSWAWDEDGDEADGKDETIMPWDTGRGDHPNRDIVDDEIHGFLVALTEKTPHVTFVFDSCHSGSITRAAGRMRSRSVRGARKGDPLPPPAREEARARIRGRLGRAGPSGFLSGLGARYVLVAGCHDEEESYEHPGEDGVSHGALSYHLYGYLATAAGPVSWRDAFEHVSALVTGANDRQHPQLEGAAERAVFGVETLEGGRYLLVNAREGGEVTLGGGAAHGIRAGSTWTVLPPGSRDDEEPRGVVEVTAVSATSSTARVVEEASEGAVGPPCRVREREHPWGDFRFPVHLAFGDGVGAEGEAVRERVEGSRLLRLVDDPEEAELVVHRVEPGGDAEAGGPPDPEAEADPTVPPVLPALDEPAWVALARGGGLKVPPHTLADHATLVRNLEAVARYRNALSIRNPSPRSELAGKVRAELLRAPPAPEEARTDPRRYPPAEPETAGGSLVLDEGDWIGLRIHNGTREPVWVNVLDFDLSGGISRLYPDNRQGVQVEPGSWTVPMVWELFLPEAFPFADDRYGPRQDRGQEVYKFVFTREPADLGFLTQEALERGERPRTRSAAASALEFLAEAATFGTRNSRPVFAPVEDDWAVVDKPFVVRRARARPLPGDGTPLELEGATVAADGLTGTVRAHGWDDRRVVAAQAAGPLDRALEGAGMETAATFEIDGEAAPARTRGAAPAVTFELDAPPEGWGQVLLSADEAGVLRFHFGDEAPGGAGTRSARGGRRLRYTIPGTPAPSPEAPRTRGLAGALGRKFVKVLLFHAGEAVVKASGQTLATIWERNRVPYRLRSVTPDDYAVPDAPDLTADDPAWGRLSGGRALLLVHGTFSRTDRAFGGFAPDRFAELHDRYDGRVFAFDHHTLSQTPAENVARLAELLPPGLELDVDVVAHSRGGLVARRLAAGGARGLRVHRVVFAGSPNAGTEMASPKHINRLLDVYANLLTFFPDNGVTDAMEGLLAVVQDVVLGMVDGLRGLTSMVPGNDADQQIEAGAGSARYFALASDFTPTELGLKTFMDPLVDQIFRGAGNDLVVPADSVWRAPESPPFPLPDDRVLLFGREDGVGHSDYFKSDRAVARLSEWLRPE